MFNNFKSTVRDLERNLVGTGEELDIARDHRDRLYGQVRNARRRLETKRTSTVYPDRLSTKLIEQVKKDAPEILIREIDIATGINSEFSNQVYLKPLYAVAKDKSIYLVTKVGGGWNTRIAVQILFETTAGRLQDYARGVVLYRNEVLKTKVGKTLDGGRKATKYWSDKVYTNSGLLARTILGRLRFSGRTAPFWQILNSGSVEMSSDRGDGSYNPITAVPTDFTGEAERQMKINFDSVFLPEYAKWFEEIQELRGIIEEGEGVLDDYRSLVSRLSVEVKSNRAVFNALGAKNKYVDEAKLAKAISRLRAGEDFDKKEIELTKTGSGGRARISVRKLEGLINSYD